MSSFGGQWKSTMCSKIYLLTELVFRLDLPHTVRVKEVVEGNPGQLGTTVAKVLLTAEREKSEVLTAGLKYTGSIIFLGLGNFVSKTKGCYVSARPKGFPSSFSQTRCSQLVTYVLYVCVYYLQVDAQQFQVTL